MAWDRTYSQFRGKAKTFTDSQSRLHRKRIATRRVDELRMIYDVKKTPLRKNESLYAMRKFCPTCAWNLDFCKSSMNKDRRFLCRMMTSVGEHVYMYMPSPRDKGNNENIENVLYAIRFGKDTDEKELIEYTKLSRRQVQKALKFLLKIGEITVKKVPTSTRGKRKHVYNVNYDHGFEARFKENGGENKACC
jgi:hypothetical protein